MNATASFYRQLAPAAGAVRLDDFVPSLHAMPTVADGTPCGTAGDYTAARPHGLEACGYDGAGHCLRHLYGAALVRMDAGRALLIRLFPLVFRISYFSYIFRIGNQTWSRSMAVDETKIVQGGPKFWANFRDLIGILSQSVGPSLATGANPVQFSFDCPALPVGQINGTAAVDASIVAFDQRPLLTDGGSGLAPTGYAYIPARCRRPGAGCRVHIFFHGCGMAATSAGPLKLPSAAVRALLAAATARPPSSDWLNHAGPRPEDSAV